MNDPIVCAFHWSGGKDSAHALGRLLADPHYEVRRLITTTQPSGESTVHRLPRHLLRAQARAINLPLQLVTLTDPGLADYAERMGEVAGDLRCAGIEAVAFGDLSHSGAAEHRREIFEPAGLGVVQPLAGMSSTDCTEEFLESRIEAITVVVDDRVLGPDHLATSVDEEFVASLPAGADPSGELGEYHSFVWNTPYFGEPVTFSLGAAEHTSQEIGTDRGPITFGYWRQALV